MTEQRGAATYGDDADQAPIEPFVFQVKGAPDLDIPDSPEITVHEPDGGTVMELLDPRTPMRTGLRLLIGSAQWSSIAEHIERLRYPTVLALVRDISAHFGIDEADGGNRAERRRRRR